MPGGATPRNPPMWGASAPHAPHAPLRAEVAGHFTKRLPVACRFESPILALGQGAVSPNDVHISRACCSALAVDGQDATRRYERVEEDLVVGAEQRRVQNVLCASPWRRPGTEPRHSRHRAQPHTHCPEPAPTVAAHAAVGSQAVAGPPPSSVLYSAAKPAPHPRQRDVGSRRARPGPVAERSSFRPGEKFFRACRPSAKVLMLCDHVDPVHAEVGAGRPPQRAEKGH